jgi:hypothetical protein
VSQAEGSLLELGLLEVGVTGVGAVELSEEGLVRSLFVLLQGVQENLMKKRRILV